MLLWNPEFRGIAMCLDMLLYIPSPWVGFCSISQTFLMSTNINMGTMWCGRANCQYKNKISLHGSFCGAVSPFIYDWTYMGEQQHK